MTWLKRPLCSWARWQSARSREGMQSWLGERLRGHHLAGCDDCREGERELESVERALGQLRAEDRGSMPREMRVRLLAAYHQEVASRPPSPASAPPPSGWLERCAWLAGGLAATALVGLLLWSRLDDFRPPPRTVRIELPPGTFVDGEPRLVVRRASGREEVRMIPRRTMLGAAILILAVSTLLVPGAHARQLELEVRAVDDSSLLFARSADLEAGDEVRFVRSGLLLSGRTDPLKVVVLLAVHEAGADRVTVAMSGVIRSPDAGGPLAWTSRTYTLERGETASFVAEPAGQVRFSIGFAASRAVEDEARPVKFRTTLRLAQVTDGAVHLLSEQRIRLEGPEPTEIRLHSAGVGGPGPDGPGSGLFAIDGVAAMVIRLLPIERDDAGVVLALDIEVPTNGSEPRTIREERLELGWDDTVHIAGLRSDRGEVLVEIEPER